MMPFTNCPLCGGELETKLVEKIVRGGQHTAVLNVSADVCLHCGEKLYSEDTVRYFENIRYKLAHQDINDFKIMGNNFSVSSEIHSV
ncbi:MAG: YgiT-type zinc finger protein [Methylococcaceae bacterium]